MSNNRRALLAVLILFVPLAAHAGTLSYRIKKYGYVPALGCAGFMHSLTKNKRYESFLQKHNLNRFNTALKLGLFAYGFSNLGYNVYRIFVPPALPNNFFKRNTITIRSQNATGANKSQKWSKSVEATELLCKSIQQAFPSEMDVLYEIDNLLKLGISPFAKTSTMYMHHSPMYFTLFESIEIDQKAVLKILAQHGYTPQEWVKTEEALLNFSYFHGGPQTTQCYLDYGIDPLALIPGKDFCALELAINSLIVDRLELFEKSGHFAQWVQDQQNAKKVTNALTKFLSNKKFKWAKLLLELNPGITLDASLSSCIITPETIQFLAKRHLYSNFYTLKKRIAENPSEFKVIFDELAFKKQDIAAVKLLLSHGYDINTKLTHYPLKMSEFFDLSKKAEATRITMSAQKPVLDRAKNTGNQELIKLVEEALASKEN